VPEIVGALFDVEGGCERPLTRIVKGPMERVSLPSVIVIVTSPLSPTFVSAGVPVSSPVSSLKVAHTGLLVMVYSRKSPSASFASGWKEYICPAVTVAGGVPLTSGG
jgi:hypothetical protein